MTQLGSLLGCLLHKRVRGATDVEITGISYHSERVRPGHIFVCLPGTRGHGTDYVNQAIAAGAVAIVSEEELNLESVTCVQVHNSRLAMALLSAEFYGYPSRELVLTGVTGTNGKTTTTHLIDAIYKNAGFFTGLLGTVNYRILDVEYPALATTPEASDLQELLRKMRTAGVTHATMEVSSHALALYRTVGCDFDTVVLTNITEDHLDFHRTFQHYLNAKSKLFAWLGSFPKKQERFRRAVINGDDANWRNILEQVPGEPLLYGLGSHCHVRAEKINFRPDGMEFEVLTPFGRAPIKMKLTGMFSVYNALAAISCALLEGLSLSDIRVALEKVRGVPGRFETVDVGQDFMVIVDYAHTPDGLDNVLRAVREFAGRRIITVFGCGGQRDRSKRPLMGEAAALHSDFCLVTSDNPRGEDPDDIIAEILPGLNRVRNGCRYEVIADRAKAIERAVQMAEPGDVVVIAGKGHETRQIFQDYSIPFDDREVARNAILKYRIHGNNEQGDSGDSRREASE